MVSQSDLGFKLFMILFGCMILGASTKRDSDKWVTLNPFSLSCPLFPQILNGQVPDFPQLLPRMLLQGLKV